MLTLTYHCSCKAQEAEKANLQGQRKRSRRGGGGGGRERGQSKREGEEGHNAKKGQEERGTMAWIPDLSVFLVPIPFCSLVHFCIIKTYLISL